MREVLHGDVFKFKERNDIQRYRQWQPKTKIFFQNPRVGGPHRNPSNEGCEVKGITIANNTEEPGSAFHLKFPHPRTPTQTQNGLAFL